MKLKKHKTRNRMGAGNVMTGLLVGSVVGATVGWLTAPASGAETRRRLKGEAASAREKAKTAAGNFETQARELMEEVRDNAGQVEESVARRRKAAPANS